MMTPEEINGVASSAVMVGWAMLILGLRRFAWFNAVPLWIIPAALSAAYAAIVLSRFSGIGGGFDSLASVAILMDNEWALLAGWIHFLAFDLLVGAVMAARMDRVGVGPLGFLIAGLTELGLRLHKIPTQTRGLKGATHVFE